MVAGGTRRAPASAPTTGGSTGGHRGGHPAPATCPLSPVGACHVRPEVHFQQKCISTAMGVAHPAATHLPVFSPPLRAALTVVAALRPPDQALVIELGVRWAPIPPRQRRCVGGGSRNSCHASPFTVFCARALTPRVLAIKRCAGATVYGYTLPPLSPSFRRLSRRPLARARRAAGVFETPPLLGADRRSSPGASSTRHCVYRRSRRGCRRHFCY